MGSRTPAWLLPLTAFGVAAVLSIVAEGHLVILARAPLQTTPNCSAAFKPPYALAGVKWTMTISSIRTVTSSDNPGESVINDTLTFTARFTVKPKKGKPIKDVAETFMYITMPPIDQTTAAGNNVLTNYPNIVVSADALETYAKTQAATKYSQKDNPVTIKDFEFQPVWETSLSGVWTAPLCPITSLGPLNFKVEMNARGTGNGTGP